MQPRRERILALMRQRARFDVERRSGELGLIARDCESLEKALRDKREYASVLAEDCALSAAHGQTLTTTSLAYFRASMREQAEEVTCAGDRLSARERERESLADSLSVTVKQGELYRKAEDDLRDQRDMALARKEQSLTDELWLLMNEECV